MAKEPVLKYAGVSVVTNEKGETTAHFHKSNQTKYAVWSNLPENERGPGHRVTFYWFKLPANTTKLGAIKFLLGLDDKEIRASVVQTMLKDKLIQLDPAARPPKPPRKAATKAKGTTKKKKNTVHVEVEKKLTDSEAAEIKEDNLAKLRKVHEARKAGTETKPTEPATETDKTATSGS